MRKRWRAENFVKNWGRRKRGMYYISTIFRWRKGSTLNPNKDNMLIGFFNFRFEEEWVENTWNWPKRLILYLCFIISTSNNWGYGGLMQKSKEKGRIFLCYNWRESFLNFLWYREENFQFQVKELWNLTPASLFLVRHCLRLTITKSQKQKSIHILRIQFCF